MAQKSPRRGEIRRTTKETDITLALVLDGSGLHRVATGVPFLDHMLTLFSVHGFFDLEITAQGDTEVDDHHTVEDIGICLGQAFKQALGDYSGINRYGDKAVPMDEALVRVTLDCSNRPHLHYGLSLDDQKVGRFDTALAKEFLRAFTLHGGITMHADMVRGENAHHILEAMFKAMARALDEATAINTRSGGPLSSKGSL